MIQHPVNVRIFKRVKVDSKWRNCSVAHDAKNKIRWDHVMVDGKVELHREGNYYIEWWENGVKKQQSVGSNESMKVMDAARDKIAELGAVRRGLLAPNATTTQERKLMVDAATDYIDLFHSRVRPDGTGLRTWRTYRPIMRLFAATCRKKFIDELDSSDARQFIQVCYKEGNDERTAYNKLVVIAQFAKKHGVENFVQKDDWPKYVEKKVQVYEDDDLVRFFAACDDHERVLFRFFLHTGFRDREVMHVSWADIDFKNHVASVTAKPQWRFRPKNYEERDVPVKASFMDELRLFKPKDAQPWQPVFANTRGNPDGEMIEMCKRIAHRAGLNCRRCRNTQKLKDGSVRINRCAEGSYCNNWFLHKFRHTYATRLLQQGVVDVRTLQDWLGHKDLAATMRYLKAVKNKDAHARLDAFAVGGD